MPRKSTEPKAVITAEVKAVIHSTESQKARVDLRVVNWIADGKDTGAKFEKRSFFKKKDGTFSDFGACKGLTKTDIELLIENWPEIKMFFQ